MGQRGRPRHPDVLTPREQDVLALVRDGLTNEQIAERLNISFETAKSHVAEILARLGVATREEAAAWQPKERRAWWLGLSRWVLAGAAAAVLGALALLALGIWLSGASDSSAAAAGWPDCPPVQAQQFAAGIYVLDGGNCGVSTLDGTSMVEDSPVWSQDGRQIAFLGASPAGATEIFVADTETGNVTQITDSETAVKDSIAWTPDGGLIFSSVDTAKPGNNVTQLNYDMMFAPPGEKPRVVSSGRGCIDVAVSSLGKVAVEIGCSTDSHVALIDLTTGAMTTILGQGTYGLSWSPDGESMMFGCPSMSDSDVSPACIKRKDSVTAVITADLFPGLGAAPFDAGVGLWSSDGSSVVFLGATSPRIYVLPTDGTDGSVYNVTSDRWGFPNSSWTSGKVIEFEHCQEAPLPSPTVIDGQTIGYANTGPCPDQQTLSRDIVSGEERVIVQAHCATLTQWSPSGARLAIVVPAHPVCGV